MGSFRRRTVIVHRSQGNGGEARAVLEDDFHHFRVVLRHEFEHVVHIAGAAPRHPYSLCPQAIGPLQALLGLALSPVASAVTRAADPSQQCTHLLDLAGLALAAAATRRAHRQYDVEVLDRDAAGVTQARLCRDGEPLIAWTVDGSTIVQPAPYDGVSLVDGMARWAIGHLSQDEAEAAIVLRRCALISMGRGKNLDAQLHAMPTGRCFAQQPARAGQALRMVGSTWDFSGRPAALAADDERWLAFEDEGRP